tara:strand:- start:56 stop:325 length:270 start_codon:yes stop_codon:yes gene_type:complete
MKYWSAGNDNKIDLLFLMILENSYLVVCRQLTRVLATPVITSRPPIPIASVNCSSRRTMPAMIEVTGRSIKKGDILLTSQIRKRWYQML